MCPGVIICLHESFMSKIKLVGCLPALFSDKAFRDSNRSLSRLVAMEASKLFRCKTYHRRMNEWKSLSVNNSSIFVSLSIPTSFSI